MPGHSRTSSRLSANSEAEKKEKKRQQNCIAQRTYRQNQKERLQFLENAMARSMNTIVGVDGHPTPTGIEMATTFSNAPTPLGQASDDTLWRRASSSTGSVENSQPTQSVEEVNSGLVFGDRRTALHRAILLNNGAITTLLLDEGADIAAQDTGGYTPLHLAAETGSSSMLKLLLDRLADPNAMEFQGRTALFPAVQAGDVKAIETLLAFQTDIDRKDLWGKTALHVAVENGQESIVRLLLKHGADINS